VVHLFLHPFAEQRTPTKGTKGRTHLDQLVVAHPQSCEVVEGLVVTELDVVDMTIPARVQRVLGMLGGGGVGDGSLDHSFSELPQF
jgi:F0F1-type ATP synthase beta subunit